METTGKNRPLTVVTSNLMLFTVEAEHWEPVRNVASGQVQTSVKVYRAEPGSGKPSVLVAEFPDVSAVYFSDAVTLVKPGD